MMRSAGDALHQRFLDLTDCADARILDRNEGQGSQYSLRHGAISIGLSILLSCTDHDRRLGYPSLTSDQVPGAHYALNLLDRLRNRANVVDEVSDYGR